jgi:hypothetical protein
MKNVGLQSRTSAQEEKRKHSLQRFYSTIQHNSAAFILRL